MAGTCSGFDASVPPEIMDVLKKYLSQKRPNRPYRGPYLDGRGNEGDYCLLELLGRPRCALPGRCDWAGGPVDTGKPPKEKIP